MVSQFAIITERRGLGESIVAIKVVEAAMKIVASGFDRDIHHGAGIAPEIGTPDTLLIEFLD